MVTDGADLLDVGGASSRPGHAAIPPDEEIARVVPVIRAIAAELPGTVISIDTTSPAVAGAALDAGAHLLNDIWGVAEDPGMVRLAAERGVPIILMHNRAEARYRNLIAEVIADLQRALERAMDAGVPWDHLVVDPGNRVRQDAGPQRRAARGPRRPARPGTTDPAGDLAQVDAGQAPGPAAGPARGGHRRHHDAGHRRRHRHRSRPRRARERPHGARRGCDPAWMAPGRVARRSLKAHERPHHPGFDGLPGNPRRVRWRSSRRRSRSRWTWSCG